MMRKLYHLLIIPFLVDYVFSQDTVTELRMNPSEKKLSVPEGGIAKFECRTPDGITASSDDFKWFDNRGKEVTSTSSQEHMYKRNVDNGLVLRVRKVVGDDTGAYMCQALINAENFTTTVHLNVYAQITFECDENQALVQYETGTINCKATAGGVLLVTTFDWNGQTLGGSSHYVITATSLKIINVTKADEGVYVYKAEPLGNENLIPEEMSIHVTVMVKPVMTYPLLNVEPVNVGKTAKIYCMATGEPDPTYYWYKGQQLLETTSDNRIRVYTNAQQGILEINNAIKEDGAVYRCQATNKAGSVETTGTLIVHTPPNVFPMANQAGAEETSLAIVCKVGGFPTPEVRWERTDGASLETDEFAKYSSVRDNLVDNNDDQSAPYKESTLEFTRLKPEFEGQYKCVATNKAGSQEGLVNITVQFGPKIDSTFGTDFYNWESNKDGHLLCSAKANPTPVYNWYKGDQLITNQTDVNIEHIYSVFSVESNIAHQTISKLAVKLTASNAPTVLGVYRCEVQNTLGRSNANLTMAKAELPGQPIVNIDHDSATVIRLGLLPPQVRGPKVTHFLAKYSIQGDTGNVGELKVPVEDRKWTDTNQERPRTMMRIEGLKPATVYVITVQAENLLGPGLSREIIHTTRPLSKPDPVEIRSAINSVHARVIVLSWLKPDDGGSLLTSYTIRYRRVNVNNVTNLGDYEESGKPTGDEWHYRNDINPESETYSLKGDLTPNTYYKVDVQAVNVIGTSVSNTRIIRTSEEQIAPGASTAATDLDPDVGHAVGSDSDVPSKTGHGEQSGLPTGAIIGIVIAIFIILFIIVDVTCYFKNNCGILMSIREKLGGGRAQDGYSPTKGDDVENLPNKDQLTEDANAAEEGKAAEADETDDKKEPLLAGEQAVDTVDECETKDEEEKKPESDEKVADTTEATKPDETTPEATEAKEQETTVKAE